jgi:hypothetical protein
MTCDMRRLRAGSSGHLTRWMGWVDCEEYPVSDGVMQNTPSCVTSILWYVLRLFPSASHAAGTCNNACHKGQ